MSPTDEYWESSLRGDLAWRVAQRVKDAERTLSAGHLETKEIRNAVDAVLRQNLTLDIEHGRRRLVGEWMGVPVQDEEDTPRES